MFSVKPTEKMDVYIQWNNLPTNGTYYNLYRSTSPESGFRPVLLNTKVGAYLDKEVNIYDLSKSYYYKIEVCDEDKKILKTYGPKTTEYKELEGISRAIINEYQVVLKVMKNPSYKLLLKKHEGFFCPECYNHVTKRVSYPNCKKCNGTGIIHGYHDPIDILLSRDISQEMEHISMLDSEKIKLTNVNAWALPYPIITPGDVVVDKINNRFRILSVGPRTHSHNLIRQVLQMVPLEKGHPAYNVEVFDDEK